MSAAHFLSHYYFLLLPPVFLWVRADYNVNYTELGFAIAVFNIVSAIVSYYRVLCKTAYDEATEQLEPVGVKP